MLKTLFCLMWQISFLSFYFCQPGYQPNFHRKLRVVLSATDSSGTYYSDDDDDDYYDSDDDESYYDSSSEVRKMLFSQLTAVVQFYTEVKYIL